MRAAGYFARVAAIRQLLLQFLAAGGAPGAAPPPKQARSALQAPHHATHKTLNPEGGGMRAL